MTEENNPDKASILLVYGLFGIMGFLEGLFVGWLVWG